MRLTVRGRSGTSYEIARRSRVPASLLRRARRGLRLVRRVRGTRQADGRRAARLGPALEDRGRARSRRATVAFTTDEATWLHLDVHPDGAQVVFSLLGDLYVLPIAGGEAKRITSGAAYDVQPRFSPDGKWIAFASDRGGIENLWICDREGKNARPGQHARRSTRSTAPPGRPTATTSSAASGSPTRRRLGTVELWMWHVKGGDGLQLTKKDEQPDAADPAFSPDGRFIYFSARDTRYSTTATSTRGSGRSSASTAGPARSLPLTGEFGGAAAPTPLAGRPADGVRAARARRRRVLELMDLAERAACGTSRTASSATTRRASRSTASSPGFDWTPDGERRSSPPPTASIWRFDAQDGRAHARSPSRAAVEQRVTDAAALPAAARRGHGARPHHPLAGGVARTASGSCSPRSATSTRWTCRRARRGA